MLRSARWAVPVAAAEARMGRRSLPEAAGGGAGGGLSVSVHSSFSTTEVAAMLTAASARRFAHESEAAVGAAETEAPWVTVLARPEARTSLR